jgi:dihydrofolate reductase
MRTYERIFLILLFGTALPIIIFLAGWWGSIRLVRENQIFLFALAGLLIGILLNFLFVGRLVDKAFKLHYKWTIALYLFYSILVFGFFMGVPVFNIGIAFIGGYYIGRKQFHINACIEETKAEAKRYALLSTTILFLFCSASATIALRDQYTIQNLKGMLGISFSYGGLWMLILIGGIVLLTINYIISIKTVTKTFSISQKFDEYNNPDMDKQISIIVAIAENSAIGKDNKLLWHISEDLKRFKKITAGHTVVMGKKTYESLPVRPLPNRRNLVITDVPGEQIEGCVMAYSIDDAITQLEKDKENFIIGGASIYNQFFSKAEKLYITRVHATFEADTFFPEISEKEWEIAETEPPKDIKPEGLRYSFVTYKKK